MAKLDKAPVYETGDYRFESYRVRHFFRLFYPVSSKPKHPREYDKEAAVKFRGWRLLGVIFIVVFVLAAISATVDILVIGPLEGRI